MIIIYGCGQMGQHLARKLGKQELNVTVIDPERLNLESLGPEFKGEMIMGLGIDKDVLKKAHISEAEVFLAVARDINTNIMCALVAKRLFHVPRVIARIEDPTLVELFCKFQIETISPTTAAAGQIERMILGQKG
ncbi:MAG: TrkA family potassium uptake protein [Cyanobacteria bacterium NC_groundwater_1444_Ag_S-0.65um_54_12]|nr:TrkA family potassium uptake protein [Cyanobacteria bacterium NC_groundwater_1444_Ag_S-0.65um_54_12]